MNNEFNKNVIDGILNLGIQGYVEMYQQSIEKQIKSIVNCVDKVYDTIVNFTSDNEFRKQTFIKDIKKSHGISCEHIINSSNKCEESLNCLKEGLKESAREKCHNSINAFLTSDIMKDILEEYDRQFNYNNKRNEIHQNMITIMNEGLDDNYIKKEKVIINPEKNEEAHELVKKELVGVGSLGNNVMRFEDREKELVNHIRVLAF